jgi:hypothetical protein
MLFAAVSTTLMTINMQNINSFGGLRQCKLRQTSQSTSTHSETKPGICALVTKPARCAVMWQQPLDSCQLQQTSWYSHSSSSASSQGMCKSLLCRSLSSKQLLMCCSNVSQSPKEPIHQSRSTCSTMPYASQAQHNTWCLVRNSLCHMSLYVVTACNAPNIAARSKLVQAGASCCTEP